MRGVLLAAVVAVAVAVAAGDAAAARVNDEQPELADERDVRRVAGGGAAPAHRPGVDVGRAAVVREPEGATAAAAAGAAIAVARLTVRVGAILMVRSHTYQMRAGVVRTRGVADIGCAAQADQIGGSTITKSV